MRRLFNIANPAAGPRVSAPHLLTLVLVTPSSVLGQYIHAFIPYVQSHHTSGQSVVVSLLCRLVKANFQVVWSGQYNHAYCSPSISFWKQLFLSAWEIVLGDRL